MFDEVLGKVDSKHFFCHFFIHLQKSIIKHDNRAKNYTSASRPLVSRYLTRNSHLGDWGKASAWQEIQIFFQLMFSV